MRILKYFKTIFVCFGARIRESLLCCKTGVFLAQKGPTVVLEFDNPDKNLRYFFLVLMTERN